MKRLLPVAFPIVLVILSACRADSNGNQSSSPANSDLKSPAVLTAAESVSAPGEGKEAFKGAGNINHQSWDDLLRRHVDAAGNVDYPAMKADRAKLEQYLRHLAANPVQNNWSRNEKMAYWINAYNAFTIKLIADNYPLSSIRDLHDGNPWDVKWIQLDEKTYTLNNIENDILRPQFGDPRIHFAVNCAAASCPPLLNRAFSADKLDQQLDERAGSFINNPEYNKLKSQQVQISKIFEWYRQDFGDLIEFLNKYATIDIRENAKIEFLEYNWALNED